MHRDLAKILRELDCKSRIIVLLALLSEALFLASLAKLPGSQVIWALVVCAVVLLAGLVAVVRIETYATSVPREKSSTHRPSAVEVVCAMRMFSLASVVSPNKAAAH